MAKSRKPQSSGTGGHHADRPLGYGNPPKAYQFPKGQSGNRRGSSKKVRARKAERESSHFDAAILDASMQPVNLTENGKSRKVSTIEAILRRASVEAVNGDRSAQKLVIPHVQAAHERQQAAAMERFGLLVQYVTSQSIAQHGRTPRAPHDAHFWPHPDDVVLDYTHCIGEVIGPIDSLQAEPFDALIDDHRVWLARLAWLEDKMIQVGYELRDLHRNASGAITGLLDTISRALPPSFKSALDWETSEIPAAALEIEGGDGRSFNLALIPPEGNEMAYCLYRLFEDARTASGQVRARAKLDIVANTTGLVNRLQIERKSRETGMAPVSTAPDFAEFYDKFTTHDPGNADEAAP